MENRKEVYFDNSATTRVFDSVRDVMVEAMTSDYGNTSSRHMKGVEAERYIREAREETGLTLTDYRYRGIVTFVSDRWPTEYMHLFTADGFTGTLKECDEGDLEWIPKSHLLELPHWEGDAIFLALLDREEEPFFSLKLRYEGETLAEAVLNGTHLKGGPAV